MQKRGTADQTGKQKNTMTNITNSKGIWKKEEGKSPPPFGEKEEAIGDLNEDT